MSHAVDAVAVDRPRAVWRGRVPVGIIDDLGGNLSCRHLSADNLHGRRVLQLLLVIAVDAADDVRGLSIVVWNRSPQPRRPGRRRVRGHLVDLSAGFARDIHVVPVGRINDRVRLLRDVIVRARNRVELIAHCPHVVVHVADDGLGLHLIRRLRAADATHLHGFHLSQLLDHFCVRGVDILGGNRDPFSGSRNDWRGACKEPSNVLVRTRGNECSHKSRTKK